MTAIALEGERPRRKFRHSEETSDRFAPWLVAATLAAAPTHMWSIFDVAKQGVTLSLLVGVLFAARVVTRGRSIPAQMKLVIVVLGGLGLWGLVNGVQLGQSSAWSQALLYSYSVAVMAGASTVRLDNAALVRVCRLLTLPVLLVVLYGAYQTLARRNDWPLAFLPATNPGLSTDPLVEGMQPGASGDGTVEYLSRASSFFIEPTNFGMFLAYIFAFSLATLDLRTKTRALGYGGLVVVAMGFASNQSLTAVATCGAILVAYIGKTLISRDARRALLIAGGVGFAILGISWLPGALDALTGRLVTLSLDDSSGRFISVPLALAAVDQQPLGYGFGGHVFISDLHNGALVLMVDFGIPGLLVPLSLLLFAGHSWLGAVRADRNKESEDTALRTLSFALPLVHVVIMSSSGLLFEPLFWSLSGIGVAASVQAAYRRRR